MLHRAACIVQVQKLKLDTEAAMLELDQILRANELTVAVVAAIPSLAIAGGTGYLLIRWITPSPPDRKSEALPARSIKTLDPESHLLCRIPWKGCTVPAGQVNERPVTLNSHCFAASRERVAMSRQTT